MDRTEEKKLDLSTGELFIEHKELTGNERPWRVESERQDAKAFKDLQRAMEFFHQQVTQSSAGKRP